MKNFLLKKFFIHDGYSEFCLKILIPAYIASHFDVQIANVTQIAFGPDGFLSNECVLACLFLLEINVDNSNKANSESLSTLAKGIKQSISKDFEKKYGSIDGNSPISLSDWDEIPLPNLLILTDGCFYDIRHNSADLVYLAKEMKPGGSRIAPTKRTKFSDSDHDLFQKKLKYLNFSQKDTNLIQETNFKKPPPYEVLLNLCYSLLESNLDELQIAYASYMDEMNHPFVLALTLSIHPSFNLTMIECQEILSRALSGNWRYLSLMLLLKNAIAVALWNALKQTNYELPPPGSALLRAAAATGIELLL